MNKNKLQLVSFEQAQKLKELGFGWFCRQYYTFFSESYCKYIDYPILSCVEDDEPVDYLEWDFYVDCRKGDCLAPEIALALKWFRDVNNFFSKIEYIPKDSLSDGFYKYCYNRSADTYEEAESGMLDVFINRLFINKSIKTLEEKGTE